MRKKRLFYLSVLVLALTLVSVSVVVLDYLDPYKFKVEDSAQGIPFLYKATAFPPGNQLQALAARDAFLLVPSFSENSAASSYMGPAWILYRSILSANDKEAESVLRVYSKSKQLLKCQLDAKNGDNKEISVDACNSMIAASKEVEIFIEAPDSSLPKSEVIVGKDSITVKPKAAQEISPVSKKLLEFMYANTDEIVAKSNQMLEKIHK